MNEQVKEQNSKSWGMRGNQIYYRVQRSESIHSKNTTEPYGSISEYSRRPKADFLVSRSLWSTIKQISDVRTLKFKRFLTMFDCCTQHILLRELPTFSWRVWAWDQVVSPIFLTTGGWLTGHYLYTGDQPVVQVTSTKDHLSWSVALRNLNEETEKKIIHTQGHRSPETLRLS